MLRDHCTDMHPSRKPYTQREAQGASSSIVRPQGQGPWGCLRIPSAYVYEEEEHGLKKWLRNTEFTNHLLYFTDKKIEA